MTSKNYLRIPLLLLTIGLLTSCSSNKDWKKQGLNGKVKTFLELLYKPEKKFGEWDKGIYYSSGHRRLSFDVLNPNNRVFFKFISIIKRGGPLRGLLPLPHGKPREVISVF